MPPNDNQFRPEETMLNMRETEDKDEPEEADNNLKKNMSFVFENTNGFMAKDKEIQFIQDSTTTKARFSPIWRQSIAAAGSIMLSLSAGMVSGYSATLLPQLKLPNSTIEITQESESWIAAIAALPMSIGCIISGMVMEPLGRRMTHLILSIPFIVGWILISSAYTLPQLLVGRFLTGLCVGVLGPVGSVYIGETSNPKYRGFLLAGISLAISIGLLLAHLIGTFVNWQLTAAICSLVPFVGYLIMSFMPESPSWLLRHNRREDAVKAFKWLRGCDPASLEELNAMIVKQESSGVDLDKSRTISDRLDGISSAFRRPEFYKPLSVMIVFYFTLQLSGVNAVAFYSVSIMKSTLGEGLNEYTAMLIVDCMRLLVSIVACVILRIVGRRPLAIISGTFTAASLFGLVAFKHFAETEATAWVPLVFLIGYIIATTIGIMPLPWVMVGEVFPIDLRGMGSGICTCMCFLAFFTVVKCAPVMLDSMGINATFSVYGSFALIGTILIYFFLPETKGRTLQDVEESFKRTKSDRQQIA